MAQTKSARPRGATGLLLLAIVATGAGPGEWAWKAELEMSTSNFTASDGSVAFTRLVYDVYQSRAGIVRLELKSAQPPLGKVTGIGRDVHIIDFAQGTVVAFDKDKPTALRYTTLEGLAKDPLAGPHERLGPLTILGQRCQGAASRSESHGLTELRESWTATEAGFRYPVLDIARTIVEPEAARKLGVPEGLLSLTVRTISRLEKVKDLDERLFQVPGGYAVVDVA